MQERFCFFGSVHREAALTGFRPGPCLSNAVEIILGKAWNSWEDFLGSELLAIYQAAYSE